MVVSLGAPLGGFGATETAQADTSGSLEGTCETELKYFFLTGCAFAEAVMPDPDTDPDTLATEVHVQAAGVADDQDRLAVLMDNRLEDTPVLASLEARHAIASAYEEDKSSSEAAGAASAAINDYYSQIELNLLRMIETDTVEQQELSNVSIEANESGTIDKGFILPVPKDGQGDYDDPTYLETNWVEINEWEFTRELQNGTEINYRVPGLKWDDYWTSSSDFTAQTYMAPKFEAYNESAEGWHIGDSWESSADHKQVDWIDNSWSDSSTTVEGVVFDGRTFVTNDGTAGLPAQPIYDYSVPAEQLREIEEQRNTSIDLFDTQLADDLYQLMDDGEVTPDEVRSAEGMIRYKAGDKTSGEAWNAAFDRTLGTSSNLSSTIDGEFTGVTGYELNETSDEYEEVEETVEFEGVLFSSDPGTDTLETGETYNLTTWNATPSASVVRTDDAEEDLTMYDGNLTVNQLYINGNETDSINLDPGPDYTTYDNDDYLEYLDTASEDRVSISEHSGLTGPVSLPGDGFSLPGGLELWIIVLLGAAAYIATRDPNGGNGNNGDMTITHRRQ